MQEKETFYSVGLTHEQLTEVYHALLSRYVIDETFRRERDEESIDPPALMSHLERLLGVNPETAHSQFHEEEDRLWEYAWYAYTDEWAWYRARQDVEQTLGHRLNATSTEAVEQLIEKAYEEHFDRYTKEIDMAQPLASSDSSNTPPTPTARRTKK